MISRANSARHGAQTVLFLNDAKTGLQVAAAEGSASVKDFGGLGGWGGGIAGGYGNTAEGKLIAAAFFDATTSWSRRSKAPAALRDWPSALVHIEDAGIGARRSRMASAERVQVKGRGAWLCSAR